LQRNDCASSTIKVSWIDIWLALKPDPAQCGKRVGAKKMTESLVAKPNRWWTVVGGGMGNAVGAGIFMVYAFGIFGKAIATEYSWDREIISYCFTAFLVATGFGTVALGAFIARFGVRWPAAVFVGVFSAAVACVSITPASPFLFYLVFAVIGVGGAAATAMPYAVSIAGLFDRHRGMALALSVSGAGIGAALMPQLVTFLVSSYGWRIGLSATAALIGFVPLFALAVLVRDPVRQVIQPHTGQTVREKLSALSQDYLGQARFWLIAIPIVGISVVSFGIMASLVPLLSDRDFSNESIALALSSAGIASWFGRLSVGYLMDKFFAPYVAACVFTVTACGILLLIFGQSPPTAVLGAGLIGLALGAEADMVTFLASRYFSLQLLSKVLGALWVAWAWGGGLGTFLSGATFSATQSYSLAFGLYVLMMIASILVILRLGPYTYPHSEVEPGAG
jgi:MFS family permease